MCAASRMEDIRRVKSWNIQSMILIWTFERFQSLTACIILHMGYNLSGMALALIPEDAAAVILVLFVISIVVAFFMYKQVVKVSEDIPKIEEVPGDTFCVQEFEETQE